MRRAKPLRALSLLAPALVLLAVLIPAAAIAQPAAATKVSISGNADYISQNQINVYVTVVGEGGTGNVGVNVQQQRFPFGTAFGMGGTSVMCDGQRRTYAVSVFGGGFPGFGLGEAQASAQVFCPSSGPAFETQTIRVTKT